MGGKSKLLILLLILGALGGGYYYWMQRSASTSDTASARAPHPVGKAPKPEAPQLAPGAAHPMPGETVAKDQPFFEGDYGFSMVLPAGWKVVNWTDPAPAEPGKRRPAYKIRLEDPRTRSLLDFACYPYTDRSRTAVEEIFISKIQPPVPGLELDIQVDEVVKEGEMRIRRSEFRTRDAQGKPGLMRTFYYLSNDKLYTFSLIGEEQTLTGQGAAKVLDDIRILG